MQAYQCHLLGNVRQVHYNWGRPDQFHHRYEYDADNRITAAYTSRDGEHYERDAEYEYYLHGPLMRIVVGDDLASGTIGKPVQDGFGMVLNYYAGDFTNSESPLGA